MFDSLTNPYTYDSMISGSNSLFGFDEDSLMPPTPPKEDALSKAISGVKAIGPNEFEFDFSVPTKDKTIKVCVKSAVPLNLDLPTPFPQPEDDLDAPEQPKGLGKRKRKVMVEIKPRQVRRKEERWDVQLREDDAFMGEADEDVLMA